MCPAEFKQKTKSPPRYREGLDDGGGAEIRTPDTADMSRML